ncbi:MAG: TIGR03067 domain-containing protein, partial [Zavarzinella sp.]|nr:TIGR03067 domain-containing protein [Zavarzinella sp.]
MKVLTPILVGLLALTVGAVAAPDKEKKEDKDDLKKMEGEWKVTAWEQGGNSLPAEALEGSTWTVKGDKYTFVMGTNTEEGTFKLDAGKKPPAIDLDIATGNCKGNNQVGIYKIDGDTITICFNRPGATGRPT